MRHLVDRFYPEIIERELACAVAEKLRVPSFLVWSHPEADTAFDEVGRKTLYLGLSDGARIDTFRRLNEGRIVTNR